MAETKNNISSPEGQSRVYVLFYSFFLIPLMITVIGVLFFMVVRFVTYESGNPYEYLTQIKIGSASKRWQSAYELSKLLADPELVPADDQFENSLIKTFEKSLHDDPKVRMYLALAMGRTGNDDYGESLLAAIEDDRGDIQAAIIQALGLLQYKGATEKLIQLSQFSDFEGVRLASTVSLGQIGDSKSIPILESLLKDEQPNIRWDAAIALAKMGNLSGASILNSLLDRQYYKNFKEIDDWEMEKAILVAIQICSQLGENQFKSNLLSLAKDDPNMKIRDAAIKTLEKVYDMELING